MSPAKVGTYRLQLRPDFDFDHAAKLVDYLAELGVSHLYASPYLQAAKGSEHGYDVVDPGRVNQELGGESGRKALCRTLAQHGMGQLLDIVPNHMAIRGGQNAWWWDVLENGPSSRYSSYFDVEWQAATEDRVLLPLLGDLYGVELENRRLELKRKHSQFFIQYYDHRVPAAPRSLGPLLREAAAQAGSDQLGFLADAFADLPLPNAPDSASRVRRHRDKLILSQMLTRLLESDQRLAGIIDDVIEQINASPDKLHELLERQNYRLAYWRVGNQELDYRRFFDIDSLVGLRVEDPEVFAATHELPLRWLIDGSIDGLRIDHIDGLFDPAGYLRRLRDKAPSAWLLVEKILEGSETLPEFPVQGTTGYDFLNHAQRVLVHPDGEPTLSAWHQQLNPEAADFTELARRCKQQALQDSLASDVKRLVERLSQISRQHRRYRDFSRVELRDALLAFCACFPVYRSYITEQNPISEADREAITSACHDARLYQPALDARLFEFLEKLVLLEWRGSAEWEFVMRLQQLTGAAMAKGLEDTAFYRHCRLVALNEVGGDPSHFCEPPADFHSYLQQRSQRLAAPLNATSTHDTKRSEDVRARLLTLSEVPERWLAASKRWLERLSRYQKPCPAAGLTLAPDSATAYFLLQNLVGAWPIEQERLIEYARKAVREAKLYASWHRPDEDYERTVLGFIEQLYQDTELLADIDEFVASIRDAGFANSLSLLLLKLLAPGVPDIYQGTELWDFSLVDPDNRRPVDYEKRRAALARTRELSARELWETRQDGAVKLYVMHKALALRARRTQVFEANAGYQPLQARGPHQDRVIAFMRESSVIGIATRWHAISMLNLVDTELALPEGRWRNVLEPDRIHTGRALLTDLLGALPVAALEREEATS